MDGITLMVEEHVYIKRMLAVIRKACFGILKGQEINYEDFEKMMDFVKNYADVHHHGKEEKFLFNRMVALGGAAEKLVKYGMLIEHDLGRLHMMNLREALGRVKAGDQEAKLDVIANAISYTHLLTRHIDKEDNAAYTFAKRELSQKILDTIDSECEVFEAAEEAKGTQKKYIQLLEELEEKYNEPL